MPIIRLGKSREAIDLRAWQSHCIKCLGRHVALGEMLSPQEWVRLGFVHAGHSEEVRFAWKKALYELNNVAGSA